MPKLKSYDTDSFSFPIGKNTLKFANVRGQKTYIKNRMDRLLTKEPETIKWINQFERDSVFFRCWSQHRYIHFVQCRHETKHCLFL